MHDTCAFYLSLPTRLLSIYSFDRPEACSIVLVRESSINVQDQVARDADVKKIEREPSPDSRSDDLVAIIDWDT